jgi:hypothetical protein
LDEVAAVSAPLPSDIEAFMAEAAAEFRAAMAALPPINDKPL